MKKTSIIFFLRLLPAFVFLQLNATNIFVSTTGNDNTGDGTLVNPYATIERACKDVGPGDFIYLRGGIYSGIQHKINPANPSQYGTSTNPVTIKNYNNEEVILDGTNVNLNTNAGLLMIANWNNQAMTYFIVEGLTVRNSSQRGISYYNVENLIIRNCRVHDIQLRGIGGWGHYVTIENNEVYNAGLVNENGASGSGGWPMMIYGAVDYDSGDPSTNLIIKNNYVHNCWGEGMGPGHKSSDVTIESNTIRDVFSVGIYIDKATSTTIRGNYLYATDSTYYRFDRPFTAISWANEENFAGGALPVQDIKIYNNLIAGTGKGINYWHDDSNSDANNSYHNITVVYNTIVDVTDYAVSLDEVPAGNTQPTGCIFKNNIVENGSHNNYVGNTSAWTFSHNCWVDGIPYFDGSSSSFQGQPYFSNPSITGGFAAYKLTSWSECLDAGTAITDITTDYWGTSRDGNHPAIGMHEPSFSIYYVDAAVSSSGDGQSWATAKKTISEATNLNLNPGDIVYIKPGTYAENVAIKSNGSQIIGITDNVTVSGSNKISFPSGTDLSNIDLDAHPEEYYAYIFRSWKSNNGYYKIKEVDDAQDFVIVENSDFNYETGVAGDFNYLCAAIGRPVIYKKYSNNPDNERVILDCSTVTSADTILYIGNYIDPFDAYPADYNIIDGLDVTGAKHGIGLMCSNFNAVANGKIYSTTNTTGCMLNGNADRPANWNFIMNYKIYDVVDEAIYIGSTTNTQYNNHTHHNHIIRNEIYMLQQSDELKNAIDVKEYNTGNLIAGNTIRDLTLMTGNNGIIDVRNNADSTLIYNNTLRNIIGTPSSADTEYIFNVYPGTKQVVVFNNLIYRISTNQDYVYAVNLEGKNTSGNYFVHNTIYNIDLGILVQNYGTNVDFTVANNIFNGIRDGLIVEWTNNSSQEGKFTFQNNLFNNNPNSSSYPVSSGFIGNPNFADVSSEDFSLTASSLKAINKGYALGITIQDFALNQRDTIYDLGAYEYLPTSTHTWTGSASTDWNSTTNWSEGTIPGTLSVVTIPNNCQNYPQISNSATSPVIIKDLTIESGANIEVLPNGFITVTGYLRNYNGEAGILVKSDSTGTGSLVCDQSVLSTLQRYIPAWTSNVHGWHFLSSPVSSQAIQPEFVPNPPTAAQDFFSWDEPSAMWKNTKLNNGGNIIWNPDFETTFDLGKGYLIAYNSNQTKSFEQVLNVEDVTFTSLSRSGGNFSGWHLLGNPFSSAIVWNDGNWNMTNISGTAKIWNESNASYSDIPANNIIPAMNGFMVQVTQSTGSLTIPAASRTHANQSWFKNSDYEEIKLLVKDLQQSTAQESTIIFHPEATKGFDPKLDSHFLAGYAPQFYSVLENEHLSVNALPKPASYEQIPFNFISNGSTEYRIDLVSNSTGFSVILKDHKTGNEQIIDDKSPYYFSSEIGDNPERFTIILGTLNVPETEVCNSSISSDGKNINIKNAINSTIKIYNMNGQLVFKTKVRNDNQTVSIDESTGIYIINVISKECTISKKLLIY